MAKICGGCGKEISGSCLTAEDATWHPECFKCDGCGTPVTSYAKLDGKKLCPTCQKEAEGPAILCGKCGKEITGSYVKAGDTPYHKECVPDDAAISGSTSSRTCTKCGESISGEYLEIENGTYHPTCFKCDVCECSLAAAGGKVSYAKAKDGRKCCTACQEKLSKEGATPAEKRVCSKCNKDIQGEALISADGERICKECAPTGPCGKCGKMVEISHLKTGAMLTTSGKIYHKECWAEVCEASPQVVEGAGSAVSRKKLSCAHCGVMFGDEEEYCVQDNTGKPCKFQYQEKDAITLHERCVPAYNEKHHSGGASAKEEFKPSYDGLAMAHRPELCLAQQKAAPGDPICCVCKKSLNDGGGFTLADGKALHEQCFKCSKCGEQQDMKDKSIQRMLRSRIQHLVDGTFECAKCAPTTIGMAEPAPDIAAMKEAARLKREAEEKEKAEADQKKAEAAAGKEAAKDAAKKQAELAEQEKARQAEDAEKAKADALAAMGAWSLADLLDNAKCKEMGVDPNAKETFLSDEEFKTLFGVSKDEFAAQPKWKRDAAKKKHNLF